jgi:hypothetical protein
VLGWARLARRVAPEGLPAATRAIPVGSLFVVVAHDEGPASTSDAALAAIARVTAAIDEFAASSPRVQAAALLLEPNLQARSSASGSELDGTHEVSLTALERPVTPFAGVAQADDSAPIETSPRGVQVRTDTEDINVARIRSVVLPFGGARSGQIAPSLTLEQYAELRGTLMRAGEDHQATWTRFGVASAEAKRTLQEQFAARFRNDREAQARFLELLKKFASEPSIARDSSGDDMDLDATAVLRDAEVARSPLPFAEHRPDSGAAPSPVAKHSEHKPK